MSPPEKKLYYTLVAGLLILTLLLLMFAVSFVRLYRRRTGMLKEHLFSEISMVEEERKRMAADLHDGMGTSLAAIRMRLKMMQDQWYDQDGLHIIFDQLDKSAAQVREIIHGLIPSVLSLQGLGAAIEALADDIRGHSPLSVFLERSGNDSHFRSDRTIILYRVVQEILANVLKHASASELQISYRVSGQTIYLTIGDNGKGFDERLLAQANKTGQGLRNIAARLMYLNAQYNIHALRGEGTRYQITIPVLSMIA